MNLPLIVTLTWVACYSALASKPADNHNVGFKFIHHDHPATAELLHAISEKCPDITRTYNLSETSVEGRELIVIELTQEPGKRIPEKPEFKYVGNMHGNEVVGKEMLLRLVVYLCEEYLAGNKLVTFLLRHTRLHIMPTMNPDGWQKAYEEFKKTGEVAWANGRANANGVDLNRNFPDLDKIMFENEKSAPGHNNHLMTVEKAIEKFADLQPETRAVMRWLSQIGFVLSANLHGGDLVVNYPYDTGRPNQLTSYSATPDDATFIELAKSYSYFHGKMSDPDRQLCSPNDRFKDGITNGDAWYPVSRGMQDYNYLETNCFEITLELGCDKFPPQSQLEGYWKDNVWALLNFMLQTHIGIKGTVSSSSGRPIANAVIRVTDLSTGKVINHDILSLSEGDYYRLLGDGTYKVTASAWGYHHATKCVTVTNQNYVRASTLRTAEEVDFILHPLSDSRQQQQQQQHDAEAVHCQLLSWVASQAPQKEEEEEEEEANQQREQQFLEEVLSYLHRNTQWRSSSARKTSASRLYHLLSSQLKKLSPEERDVFMDRLLSQIRGKL